MIASYRPYAGVVALLSIVAAAATACSLVLPLDKVQCNNDNDCANLGAATSKCVASVCQAQSTPGNDSGVPIDDGTPWGCVGGDVPAGDGGLPTTIQLVPFDGFSTLDPENNAYTIKSGVRVRLCAKRDPTCASPLTSEKTSTADAGVSFDLPSIRDFYVEARADDTTPMLFTPAIVGDGSKRLSRTLFIGQLSTSATNSLAGSIGTSLDPEKGVVLTRPVNCQVYPSNNDGISFVGSPLDSNTVQFYAQDGLPTKSANQTDKAGLGGFVNVPPGNITVTASFAADQRRIGKASGIVRAGWMTLIEVPPTKN
jgi:hypothetical protein